MHITDIFKSCFVAYGSYLMDGGRAFLLNTTAILHQLQPAGVWPYGVYESLKEFLVKVFNLGTKEAKRILGSESYKIKANNILRGSEIWTTFKAAQKSAIVLN